MRNSTGAAAIVAAALGLVLGGATLEEPAQATGTRAGQVLPPPDATDVDPYRPDPPQPNAGLGDRLPAGSDAVRLMRFPVLGEVAYEDTFGACRGTNCSRRHRGVDVFAPKLTPLVAAQAGRVTWLRTTARGTAGNGVGVTDAEGWRYLYLHVNNDTPGTDDGTNPAEWRFAPGIAHGTYVEAGDLVGYLGDSGNAETTPAHVHFELRTPAGETINPYPSLRVADRARG